MATATLPSPLETARHHHAQNHLLQAAESYRQTLESNPRSRDALLGLSLIARQSNQLQPALNMAQAALACAPDFALAWANYGDLLLALHQLPKAQSAFRRALLLDPAVAAAHYGLANALALQEDFDAALPSFQLAAELAPNLAEFHFALAFAHGKLGEHHPAILAYRRAVTLRPSFASAWLNLGVELIADGRDSLAELCYQQALSAAENPNTRISTHLNLGHLHRSRRNFPQACEHYEQALALAGPNPATRYAEVQIAFTYFHLEQKQFEKAWQSLHRAESADPKRENPEIPNARGILLLAQQAALSPTIRVPQVSLLRPGNDAGPEPTSAPKPPLEAAIAAFQQAESQGHKTAASNRGNALLRLGRCEEALHAHEQALKLDPTTPASATTSPSPSSASATLPKAGPTMKSAGSSAKSTPTLAASSNPAGKAKRCRPHPVSSSTPNKAWATRSSSAAISSSSPNDSQLKKAIRGPHISIHNSVLRCGTRRNLQHPKHST
jgi:tetratricopeptide (TPR) repeat protein